MLGDCHGNGFGFSFIHRGADGGCRFVVDFHNPQQPMGDGVFKSSGSRTAATGLKFSIDPGGYDHLAVKFLQQFEPLYSGKGDEKKAGPGRSRAGLSVGYRTAKGYWVTVSPNDTLSAIRSSGSSLLSLTIWKLFTLM